MDKVIEKCLIDYLLAKGYENPEATFKFDTCGWKGNIMDMKATITATATKDRINKHENPTA